MQHGIVVMAIIMLVALGLECCCLLVVICAKVQRIKVARENSDQRDERDIPKSVNT